MSDPIKFLLHYSSNKSDQKYIGLGTRVCEYLEKRINSDGGIGGLPIKIYYEDIPHIKAGTDDKAQEYYENLLKNNKFTFARCTGQFGGIGDKKKNNIERNFSEKTLSFNVDALPRDLDLKKLNLIDLRSNAFSDSSKSFADKMNDLRKLVHKEKVFHIANMGPSSPIYKNKAELEKDNIYLFTVYNKIIEDDFKKIEKEIMNFLDDSTSSDLINIGALPGSFKPQFFDFIKTYDNNRLITLTTDSTRGLDYSDITNTILSKDNANYDVYLSMEAFLKEIGGDYPVDIKEKFNIGFGQFEIPLIIKYISDQNNLKYEDRESFVRQITECLSKINGSDDILLGVSKDFAFNNNKNTLQTSALVRLLPPKDKSSKSPIKTLFKNQLSINDGVQKISSVISLNIDIQRITNISIETGTFGAELYLDIIAPSNKPITTIKFNNLSSAQPKYEVKELESIKNLDSYSSRYLITANFDFNPIGSNYPFDSQYLYLSLSSTDNSLVIQPIPQQYLDKEFNVDGWKLLDASCGINRKKSWVALSENLERTPKINEEIRVGWELKRVNSMTLLKIGIPLSFLFILVYYTLYQPINESNSPLGYLTTAFLSSIALYFSTERPQPLSMTTIDVIFAFFYIISGVSLLMIIFSEFYISLYGYFIYPLRVALPISIIGLGLYIRSRLSSSVYKPSITK